MRPVGQLVRGIVASRENLLPVVTVESKRGNPVVRARKQVGCVSGLGCFSDEDLRKQEQDIGIGTDRSARLGPTNSRVQRIVVLEGRFLQRRLL
jgi:hypothetical protein